MGLPRYLPTDFPIRCPRGDKIHDWVLYVGRPWWNWFRQRAVEVCDNGCGAARVVQKFYCENCKKEHY